MSKPLEVWHNQPGLAQIIQFPIRPRSPKLMSLREARDFLQQSNFKFALMASFETLERYRNHSEAILSGASEAYEAVLRFRQAREAGLQPEPPTRLPCPVVRLPVRRKAA